MTTVAATVFFGACTNDDNAPEPANPRGEITLSATESALVAKQNEFAFDLYNKELAHSQGGSNVIVSPLSVAYCLGMIAQGAENSTLAQITHALGATSATEISTLHDKLTNQLSTLDRNTPVMPANSLWIDTRFGVKEQYRSDFDHFYGKNIFSLNLHEDAAVERINKWCADNTRNMITEIINEAPDAGMLLVNTLYFKGKWAAKFNKEATRPHTFNNIDNSKSTVQMMQDQRMVEYGEYDGTKAVRLPYGNGAYSIVFILPPEDAPNGTRLTADAYSALTAHETMTTERVLVEIPRFDVTAQSTLNMSLAEIGMPDLLGPSSDLSGITDESATIDAIFHKCRIITDEDGTQAAAATITDVDTALLPDYEITFDRPFTFIIEEQSTRLILFIGRINRL